MNQSDIAKTLSPVVEAFDSLGIRYYIGGSVASSTYGIARMTMDIDLVAKISHSHVSALVSQLIDVYYIDGNMITNAIDQKASFNLLHLETFMKVDIFVLTDDLYHRNVLERVRQDSLSNDSGQAQYYFASAEDIVLTKLDWYRLGGSTSEQQWNDILGVIKVQNKSLDMPYIKQWADHLSLQRLWEKALSDLGN